MSGCDVYRYVGPRQYHSIIGQIMAYLGYVGGHEEKDVTARVSIQEVNDTLCLSCHFLSESQPFFSSATLMQQATWQETAKVCLLHWHDRFQAHEPGPWGTLIGVRPTKLVHHLLDQGNDDGQVKTILENHYHTTSEIADELVTIARLQRPYVEQVGRQTALYIGIPYCSSHCLYCSFPSKLVSHEEPALLEAFTTAVVSDICAARELCDETKLAVDTIYVGGGTPTCLPMTCLEAILQAVHQAFPHVAEWTVEAGRPDTASREKLELLKQYGVDRISVNPQTMQQHLLDALGRRHRVEDIYKMFSQCRELGFTSVNMDFIAGLPRQTLEDMQENMEIVCQLVPENVTIHTLALKKQAPLFDHPLRKEIPSELDVLKMVELSRDILGTHNYLPYYMYRQKYMVGSFANIGYALPGHIGKYNIQMMEERQSIIAVGPGGANKFLAGPGQKLEKLYMPKDTLTYVQAVREKIAMRRRLCRIIYGGDD